MPHLSKQKVNEQIVQEIYENLFEAVASKGDRVSRKKILGELLTNTEKIMLAKRLAIIILLVNGVPHYQIWKKLKVSPSTIARLENTLSEYKSISLLVNKQKDRLPIAKIITGLFEYSYPAKVGPRWKWLEEFYPK